MNRIDQLFQRMREKHESALMCYLPTIGPDYRRSLEVVDAFVEGGVDFIELSVPGQYPWLDGSAMQKHHLESHRTKADIDSAFRLASLVRKRYPLLPILPMGYYGTVCSYGIDAFARRCADFGIDGVEIPDYPLRWFDDKPGLAGALQGAGVYFINFADGISLAPEGTAAYELLVKIVRGARGFIFLLASPGVTGVRGAVAVDHLKPAINRIRQVQAEHKVPQPILVGFGLASPDHVRTVVQDVGADAVVVGSAVSLRIHRGDSGAEIRQFVSGLKEATRHT